MAEALEERFSYFTDPLSPQWCTSITHHSSKPISPSKENWMRPITNSPIIVFCVWHVNSLITLCAALPPCPPPTVTTPSLCSHPRCIFVASPYLEHHHKASDFGYEFYSQPHLQSSFQVSRIQLETQIEYIFVYT